MKQFFQSIPRRTLIISGVALLLLALLVVLAPLTTRSPHLLDASPANQAANVHPHQPITLTFDQWMLPASAEDAITFEPSIDFRTRWDRDTLIIEPAEPLRYDSDYRLRLTGTVRNLLGRPFEQPLTLAFHTLPFVGVASVEPTDNADTVPLDAALVVDFDTPIVADDEIQAAARNPDYAARLPQPLALTVGTTDYAVEGTGRWLSPTRFGFYPAESLHPATTYAARLRANISGDGSAHLADPHTWRFTTTSALLAATTPADQATSIAPDQPVEVRLLPGVDVASASDHFILVEAHNGDAIPGEVRTRDDGFTFTPAAPLQRGTLYEAHLQPGVRTIHGAPINDLKRSWAFSIMGPLAVEHVQPSPDTAEVLTDTRRISVRFNHPVVPLTSIDASQRLPQPLTITPALPGSGHWRDTRTYVWQPDSNLPPATRFRVSLAPDLSDQGGSTLGSAYTWTFTTIAPDVLSSEPAHDAPYADPEAPIQVVFNQPMDPATLPGATNLAILGGPPVPGSVEVDRHIVTFTPDAPLQRGSTYVLLVAQGARPLRGDVGMPLERRITFTVAPPPALASSEPADGASEVNVNADIALNFSAPMDWDTVRANLSIAPAPAPTDVYSYTSDTRLTLGFPLQPETDYRVSVGADARDSYGTPLGNPATITFRTGALEPAVAFVGVQDIGAYSAYTPPRILLRHTNTPAVDYRLYALDPPQAMALVQDYEQWRDFPPADLPPLREGRQELAGQPNQPRLDELDIGALDAGIYALHVQSSAGPADQQLMVVSPYALTLKRSADELFLWAVDLATGEPVPGLALDAATLGQRRGTNPAEIVPIALGSTNNEGILRAPLDDANPYATLFVWGAPGDSFTFATTRWDQGINPWDFDLFADIDPTPWRGTIHTDRPIYRPDQTVHMRGALRTLRADQLTTPASDTPLDLEVRDPRGNLVYSSTLRLSEFGTFATDLRLERDVPLGVFQVAARRATTDDGQQPAIYGTFTVAEYRKPTFEVTVTPAADELVQGETLDAAIEARAFASGPIVNAPVHWRLLAEPAIFRSDTAPGYTFHDPDNAYEWYRGGGPGGPGAPELLSEGQTTTDARGRARLSLPTDLGETEQRRRFILDVEVTDIDGQVIAAREAVRIHPADIVAGVRPASTVADAGQPQGVNLVALDTQDAPVSGQELTVNIAQREWYSVREQGDDGRFYWTSAYTDTLVETVQATTDANGRAEVRYTPPAGGSYRITAEGRDDAGRLARASAFVWAAGGDSTFWGVGASNRLELIADRASYAPGDTARILVPAPYADMRALLTIERGRVQEHRLLTLNGTTEVLEVPITAEHAPNIYVSLLLLKPAGEDLAVPEMRAGLLNLPVSTAQQELTVRVTPDTERAGPRDEVTYTVRATDHTGQGVRAELALALVDKAVLTLADDANPTLREALYEERPLGVLTAQTLTALVERTTLRLQPGDKGGGGGLASDTALRDTMLDTAYWNPAVVTDESGTAQVTVRLPDNLTTWQMMARGLTVDTLVGQGSSELVATRPLLVRPALPRFLTAGDQPTIQAVVQNTTDQSIDATVTLEPGVLALRTAAEQRVSVGPGGRELVRWQAGLAAEALTDGTEQVTLRFAVEGGGHRDAVEQSIPVQRFVTPEVVASSGQVYDTPVIEALAFPDGVGQDEGEMRLELVPSLAAGVESGLTYLETYPYACTEQTVSRFLPNAVTYDLYTRLGLNNAALEQRLRANLSSGLQRLTTLQNLDGGWGWWASDESHPYLSAYVLQGLLAARNAGQGIDEAMVDRGVAYLQEALEGPALAIGGEQPGWRATSRAYVLYVLAEAGHPDRGRTVALYSRRAGLDTDGRAYLLLALDLLGGEEDRVQTLAGELMSSAVLRPTTAHWQQEHASYRTMSSTTRTTALAVQALLRADPDNLLVPNAIRYLMGQRTEGHWRTTQETAQTLLALTGYLEQSGDLEASYTYRAALDGDLLHEGEVSPGTLEDPVEVVIALTELNLGDTSRLRIEREGQGRLYYTVRARTERDASEVQPHAQGVAIERAYRAVDADTLEPTGRHVSQATQGEVVQVRLTLEAPDDLHYLVVEDMLPAGLEALDTSLNTVTRAAREAQLERMPTGEEEQYAPWWHISQVEIHDNRVALFATHLPAGTYEYTYLARATTAGSFEVLPATAYQMYEPEVFGRSAGNTFDIR